MAAVRFSAAGEVLYAYLSGEVDHDAAQSLRIQLDDALVSRTPQTLVLDFGGVGFMDSSGIGLILGRQRSARTLGTTLQIQHAPAQLRSGLGFAVMQSFMDRVKVTSRPGKGTKVVLIKRLSARAST